MKNKAAIARANYREELAHQVWHTRRAIQLNERYRARLSLNIRDEVNVSLYAEGGLFHDALSRGDKTELRITANTSSCGSQPMDEMRLRTTIMYEAAEDLERVAKTLERYSELHKKLIQKNKPGRCSLQVIRQNKLMFRVLTKNTRGETEDFWLVKKDGLICEVRDELKHTMSHGYTKGDEVVLCRSMIPTAYFREVDYKGKRYMVKFDELCCFDSVTSQSGNLLKSTNPAVKKIETFATSILNMHEVEGFTYVQ